MRLSRIAREGARALMGNKLRTVFMMAGTLLGIAALTVIMGIGQGAEKKVMERVRSFGTDVIMVSAGAGKGFSPPQEGIVTLRLEDAEAIRSSFDGIEVVAPFAMKRGLAFQAGDRQATVNVMAGDPEWHEAWGWQPMEGEPLSAEDVATMARVCLLGADLSKDLFGDQSPVGEFVQINSVRFQVKGVLERRGVNPMGESFDRRALIPLSTGLRRVYNQEHITNIRIKVRDTALLVPLGKEIQQLLHERHHITPPEEDDFAVFTAAEVAKSVRGVSGTLTAVLIALAGMSLLVGGIVMMNILLISVAERTREIGLRRALGATRGDVFSQFLVESLSVTFMGTALGSALGWGVCYVLPRFSKVSTAVSWEPFALAAAFALLVGLVFGVQPARRAARMNPVDALR